MITLANVHDSKAVDFLMRTLSYFLSPVKGILADEGYRGEIIEQVKNKLGYLINVVMRRDRKKQISSPFPKGGLLNGRFPCLIMIEDYAETLNAVMT